jgi:hypothetical protein
MYVLCSLATNIYIADQDANTRMCLGDSRYQYEYFWTYNYSSILQRQTLMTNSWRQSTIGRQPKSSKATQKQQEQPIRTAMSIWNATTNSTRNTNSCHHRIKRKRTNDEKQQWLAHVRKGMMLSSLLPIDTSSKKQSTSITCNNETTRKQVATK